jgi:hypothetical protein
MAGEGKNSMTVDTTDLTPAESYWAEVTRNADTVEGADLEKGANLIGVPFCITKAVFREGDFLNQGVTGWYVSLEALIAPAREVARAYQRGRIPEGVSLTVEPGESIIFNEGGTGVYRQVVAYLEAKGLITLPDKPEGGSWGESKYDTLPNKWEVSDPIRPSAVGPDGTWSEIEFPITLLCPRGLRQSEYENEHTKQGVTRYLA